MKTVRLFFFAATLVFGFSAAAESPIRPGDRVAIVGNTFADQLRIHGYLETVLLQHTAGNPVSIRNLGWGGDMLTARDRPTNFPSEASTLTEHKTDVIIACFGFGESFAGIKGVPHFKEDLEAFVASHAGKKYNGSTAVRLVLVSPIGYENLGTHTPNTEKRNGELQAYAQAIGEVARAANLPYVHLFEQSRYLMDEPGPDLTPNGIHLNAYGYWAISKTFASQLLGEAPPEPWQIVLDAQSGTGEARGIELGKIQRNGRTLSVSVKEVTAPSLRPPTRESLPAQLADRRDMLVVRHLAPGSYTLTVDGDRVVTALHTDWAKGVPVDASPAHRELEAYRDLINDKNMQFVYSWKALNQVHIVGERKHSASGRALPAEVKAFNALTRQRDEALRKAPERKTRVWRLVPTAP